LLSFDQFFPCSQITFPHTVFVEYINRVLSKAENKKETPFNSGMSGRPRGYYKKKEKTGKIGGKERERENPQSE
jgi:hypothetical protein